MNDQITTSHNEQNTYPLGPSDMLMKNEHCGYHTEHVRQTAKRIGLRERPMFEDIHPEDTRSREGQPASQPPPVGELAADECP